MTSATCAQVEWPLSIVVSQQALAQYQLIFRHLFELKYVEQQLNSVWQILQSTRRLYRSANELLSVCWCHMHQAEIEQHLANAATPPVVQAS